MSIKTQILFANRQDGDLTEPTALRAYLKQHQLGEVRVITMEQVHSDQVVQIEPDDHDQKLIGADGIIVSQSDVLIKNVAMLVKVADCIPAFFIDQTRGVYGLAHLGWKGSLQRLTSIMVERMQLLGSSPETIQVTIGPHICQGCYTISSERANQFIRAGFIHAVTEYSSAFHLDLSSVVREDLESVGVKSVTWDQHCTACRSDQYFSYRKAISQNKSLDGHNVGILVISRYN